MNTQVSRETFQPPKPAEERCKQPTPDPTTHVKEPFSKFPVLLPHRPSGVSQLSNTASPISPVRSSLQAASSPVVEAPDFLTLLAGQERKVLELRDELSKAENELQALKKQWANFEASKKKSELRQIAKLQPLPFGSGKDDSEIERGKQRILEQTSGKPRRHTSQRIFSGSRHARQLSLLSPTSGAKPTTRHSVDGSVPSQSVNPGTHPTLERADSVPTSTVESPKTFGKTYRDLANRHSLPPPSTDAIVRQGKQMATDLKDGLWTFFEDIRQATVGEEAVTGVQGENGRPKMATPNPKTLHRKKRFSKDSVHVPPEQAVEPDKHASFWREFGVDTPQKDDANRQVSDPLLEFDDQGWDTWESPQQKQDTSPMPASTAFAQSDKPMPWPELSKRPVPTKITRTVSDFIREWDAPSGGSAVEELASKLSDGQDHYMLTSQHM